MGLSHALARRHVSCALLVFDLFVFARLARSDTTLKSLLIMTLVSSARLASIVMLA